MTDQPQWANLREPRSVDLTQMTLQVAAMRANDAPDDAPVVVDPSVIKMAAMVADAVAAAVSVQSPSTSTVELRRAAYAALTEEVL